MTAGTQTDHAAQERQSKIALRISLASGEFAVPLDQVHHLAGFATLTGEAEDYFLGWLMMRGEKVPVFDLNRVVCDCLTAENFGCRIMVIQAAAGAPVSYIGLLAGGITDTIARDAEGVETLDLEDYLPMLYTLIPQAGAANPQADA